MNLKLNSDVWNSQDNKFYWRNRSNVWKGRLEEIRYNREVPNSNLNPLTGNHGPTSAVGSSCRATTGYSTIHYKYADLHRCGVLPCGTYHSNRSGFPPEESIFFVNPVNTQKDHMLLVKGSSKSKTLQITNQWCMLEVECIKVLDIWPILQFIYIFSKITLQKGNFSPALTSPL